jgi:tetratricopeptide (TPR) repeat protein
MGQLADYLRGLAKTLEPGPGRFAAYDVLGQIAGQVGDASGERSQYHMSVVQETKHPYFNQLLQDPNVYYWVKGRLIHAAAFAMNGLGRHESAAEWLDYGIELSTRKTAATYEILVFERARTTHLQHRYDVDGGNDALWDFVEAHPDSIHTPIALGLLADIYMSAGDYDGAATIYRQIIETYPNSDYSAPAERYLAYIGTHLVSSLPQLAEQDPGQVAQKAQWCGPHALHNMLASMNIFAPVAELAKLADTDEVGTTMLGLQKAASAKGLELSGIKAATIDEVPLPAIAFLDGHHFVMVSEAGADTITVLDDDKPARSMTRFEFARRWQGEALIITPLKQLAQVISEAELDLKKGGGGPNLGTLTTGDFPSGGGGDETCSSTQGVLAGDVNSPPSYTGISTSGVNLSIQSFRLSPMLSETDVSLPVQSGNVPLSFQRYYTQENYNHRYWTSINTSPWNNNIGASWSHNYNMYIHQSNPVEYGEGSVIFMDANSTARMYNFVSRSG